MFISDDDGVDVNISVFNERPFSGNENSPAALRQSTLTVVGRIATHCRLMPSGSRLAGTSSKADGQ
jgi:hypothetical protein